MLMSRIEQFNSMDGYTFDEGVAFLRLCQTPEGVVMHLVSTHNRNHLHSEIHKQLRNPNVRRLMNENARFSHENTSISHEIRTKSDEIKPKSNTTETSDPPKTGTGAKDNVPENDNSGTNDADGGADPTEIILTKEDVRKHENTRYEDMPNDITRELWLQRQDLYREMQQAHLKMRSVPEGEEHNEERAKWRAEVLRLDEENDKLWALIDAEIERFVNEKEKVEKKSDEKPDFDISTYRSYISKALRKKSLTDAQRVELQHRVDALLNTGVEIKPETLEKLKAVGVKIG